MPLTGVTEVRLFVSSTFRDMQREREELIKRVFPEIRILCHKRGLIWSEVDLRWGIPDDGDGEANVLSSCLDEIDRCRPYFLCILGERYGWVPPQFPRDLLRSRPWLSRFEGCSVTELEVLHGALLRHARPVT